MTLPGITPGMVQQVFNSFCILTDLWSSSITDISVSSLESDVKEQSAGLFTCNPAN